MKSYLVRLYPNSKQIELMEKTFGCTRFVYNYFLRRKINDYENLKKNLNYLECSKELTNLKKEKIWLKEPDKFALQNSLKDLENAYKNFFKYKKGFPKFKSKKTNDFSYRTNFSCKNIEFKNSKLKLPKLGLVKTRGYSNIQGEIINVTIRKKPSGKYYASVFCKNIELKKYKKTNQKIGIDLGIKNFAILSNGIKIKNPKHLNKNLAKLKKLQKNLSRKSIKSSNRSKYRLKIAKLHEKISNQRKDFLQKLTTNLIKKYDFIALEKLNVSKMLKNKRISRNISDVSWFEFIRILTYKSIFYGKEIIQINTFFPSSQICFSCGNINKSVKNLNMREWVCPNCGEKHDRDINAAKNILKKGLEIKNN